MTSLEAMLRVFGELDDARRQLIRPRLERCQAELGGLALLRIRGTPRIAISNFQAGKGRGKLLDCPPSPARLRAARGSLVIGGAAGRQAVLGSQTHMGPHRAQSESEPRTAGQFTTTHWSVVLAAADRQSPRSAAALERLCQTYWYPLYAYVRRRGYGAEDAQDLTQEFFAQLLSRQALAHLTREGGKFRSFLLKALNHFLINEWEHRRAQKRDRQKVAFSLDALDPEARYRLEPADEVTPEILYERQWADTLLEQVMNQLGKEYTSEGKMNLFRHLQPCLTGAEPRLPYAMLAVELGLTEAAVKMAVHRLRKRYGDLLRTEIAHTVARPEEINDEIRHLIAVSAR